MRRQRGGRLVEHQDLGVLRQRAHDLDDLLQADAKLTGRLLDVDLIGKQGFKISYWEWFLLQWPYLGMFVITQWWVRTYFRTKGVAAQGGSQAVEQQYREIPRMSQSEWLILAVFAFVAGLWAFESQLKIAAHNAALIGLAILFMPGVLSFKWKEIQDRTIWGTLLLLAGALSMSDAMGKTGLAQWLADLLHLRHGAADS